MRKPDPAFSVAALAETLFGALKIPAGASLRVAYSGGLDSHALLHALAALRVSCDFALAAVHIDHGLQPASAAWAEHAARVCRGLGIACEQRRVTVTAMAEEGLEAAARRARYAALAETLAPGEFLLTAHQRDDQAETVLLQLLRGAGVAGLAAMPARAPFGRGEMLRPLLGFPRVALEAYAREQRLEWVEDPSNADARLRRNFLRHEILPRLHAHWPQAELLLARSAAHAAETAALLDEIAQADLAVAGVREARGLLALSVEALATLTEARRRNLVRYWLRQQGFRAPAAHQLEEILGLVHVTPRSRQGCVHWPGAEVWRYRDRLVALAAVCPPDAGLDVAWDARAPLSLPGIGRLHAEPARGRGLARACLDDGLRVRLRHGGEVLQLPGRRHHHALKKLLQAEGVPPWERLRLPLFYAGRELVAVADYWVSGAHAAARDEEGLALVWEPFADAREPEKIR